MALIKNFDVLDTSPERTILLDILESGLSSIQPETALKNNVINAEGVLKITDKTFNLQEFARIFLIGFGKGSGGNAVYLEQLLGDALTEGYVIDTEAPQFAKIQFTPGTHPLPSETNYTFTKSVVERMEEVKLTEKDLVLVIICGGGSAMFVSPESISFDQKIAVNKALLKSGATITEMNYVRKHLSRVKGGGLAKILHPARVATLIFSDVPENDLSVIASGPTVKDPSTMDDAFSVLEKYKLLEQTGLIRESLHETPKEDIYFERVENILVLSNQTALTAMKQKAEEHGITASIFSDKFQSEARLAGEKLIAETQANSILLAGGETTVTVTGNGIGGRNQEVVLAALKNLNNSTIIASIASDGWDNSENAGAIGDRKSFEKANTLNLDPEEFLMNNNSFTFFENVGDGIKTNRLPSNVSDLFIVWKKG